MKKKPGFLWLMVAVVVTGGFGAVNALAWPVPDTGQTQCYNNTVAISCPAPGGNFYGQDASYTVNPMSYTKLDAAGNALPPGAASWTMVRDNVTGLVWEVKQNRNGVKNYANPRDADNTYSWYDTEDFLNALNSANYGGHNDWRLPTIKELASIVNYNIPDPGPTLNTGFFSYTQSDFYWSSTTNAYNAQNAWTVYFFDGFTSYTAKTGGYYVRAVRGEPSGASNHLAVNGDGTVTDTETGLMWQQATAAGIYTWQQGLAVAENLTFAGYSDWRLPAIKELRSLAEYAKFAPAINTTVFPGTQASWYWSSTTYAYTPNIAWAVNFLYGSDSSTRDKADGYYIRTVRCGQAGPLGHSVMLTPRKGSTWNIGAVMPIRWNTQGLGANVRISLSRQGGKAGTFETVINTTPNDGNQEWPVAGPVSVNCVIKIEQAGDPSNWASEGMFVIKSPANPAIYLLLLE